MQILDQKEIMIVNSEFVERFLLVPKDDCHLIIASYSETRNPVTLGRYAKHEVYGVLSDLFAALSGNRDSFLMPPSSIFEDNRRKHDARTKRKGGS